MNRGGDWCRDNLRHLQDAAFRFVKYSAPSQEWEHDHCIGCWATFAETTGPDILSEGYVHLIPCEPSETPPLIEQAREAGMRCISQPTVDGFRQAWVCSQCFDLFRKEL
jgi:hypothetical protein